MTNRIKGKFIVVTGATAGIGKAVAQIMAESGANLMLTGRREERLEELSTDLKDEYDVEVGIASFDVRDRDACKTFIDSLETPVDILVNNAGLAAGKDPIDDADFEDWDTMIDTNIKGLLSMTRFISPLMKKRGKGHIINIGSIAGHEAYQGGSVYCATKHAVKAITEAAKKDLHGTGIRVSMVSPGLVNTEFSTVRFHGDKEAADQVYENMHPLVARDIAEIVHFVANRPEHVDIMDTLVLPTAQSSATMVYRDED